MPAMDKLQSTTPSPHHAPEPLNCYGAFEFGVRFVNHLTRKVHIRFRDGLLITLIPIANIGNPCLLQIEKEYSGTAANVNFNSDGRLNALSGVSSEAKVLLDSLSTTGKRFSGTSTARVRYALSLEDINNNGGNVYFKALDVVISVSENIDEVPEHPYSHGELNRTTRQTYNHVEFDLIDNSEKLGKRFMYFNESVFELVPRKDLTLQEGLHIRFAGDLKNLDGSVSPAYRFIPTDELEGDHPYASFPTWSLMQTRVRENNKTDRIAKAELDKLDREKELAELKHRLEVSKEEIKLSQQKAEEARQALEAARKDYYEKKSYERKDNSELLKYLVLVGSVLLAVWKR